MSRLDKYKKKHFKSKSKKGLRPWLPALIISKTNEVVFQALNLEFLVQQIVDMKDNRSLSFPGIYSALWK